MVVLDGGGMLTSGSSQYLQPDYLSPLPTTLDAKKSPLALLAQTCSQIGADSPNAKPLIPPLDAKPPQRNKPTAPISSSLNSNNDSNNVDNKAEKTISAATTAVPSPPAEKLVFKPYENITTSHHHPPPAPQHPSQNQSSRREDRPSSKANSEHSDEPKKSRTPGCKSESPSSQAAGSDSAGRTLPPPGSLSAEGAARGKSASPASSAGRGGGASPIIRSGLEILHGHPKDLPLGTYKPTAPGAYGAPLSAAAAAALCCPPGLDANPAFRPPFGAFSTHGLLPGYPPVSSAAAAAAAAAAALSNPGPYVSYARVKTATGGEALVPVCKDPYCTGCQFSVHNAQFLAAAAAAASPSSTCPSGCTQCDHQKYGLALSLMSAPPPPQAPPPHHAHLSAAAAASYSPLGSAAAAAAAAAAAGRPYVCNWIAGDAYCGKRFASSEELLQHLRTHTSLASGGEGSGGLLSPVASHASLLSGPSAALHRASASAAAAAAAAAYPSAPLSPLSAARYHPYAKPGLGASPYSAFNPTPLGPYYCSPYSLYGQRMGAAVHP
ncbi:zinc finger protein Noc-like [Hetaerina americana]|uniref:zinc finger protein Noc-like n=1 Tax=Hetaerina americana TaxID=62018 RepID=UPI003A7F56C0